LALQSRIASALFAMATGNTAIAENEFLFDVVQDPRERANLKNRHRTCLIDSKATGGVEQHYAAGTVEAGGVHQRG